MTRIVTTRTTDQVERIQMLDTVLTFRNASDTHQADDPVTVVTADGDEFDGYVVSHCDHVLLVSVS